MLPGAAGAGPLEQPGQQREDRRRVAAGGRRLAGRQADLALGHGDAGEAVHHQHDVLALVAEPLGDPGGGERGAQPHERRARRRSRRRRRSGPGPRGRGRSRGTRGPPGRARRPARARETGGVGAAGDHRQQARLADAGAGEDADALAAPHGTSVSRARTPRPSCVSIRALLRATGGMPSTTGRYDVAQRRAAVHRPAQAVEDPAEQAGPDRHHERAAGGDHPVPRRTPRRSETGMQVATSSCRATTSARIGPVSPSSWTASPTPRSEPGDVDAEAHGTGRPDRRRWVRRRAAAGRACRRREAGWPRGDRWS